jgi:hypothetical protein
MKKRLFAYTLCLILSSFNLLAQDANTDFETVNERKDWSFSISPYALLASQATDVGGERLRQSFNDLSSMTNFGFQMISTLRYKRYLLSVDGTYARLGSNAGTDLLDVDFSIDQWIIDPKLGFLVYDDIHFREDEIIAGWSMEVNAGAKYWSNDVKVNYTLQIGDPPIAEGSLNELQSWWDLMVGFKTRIILSKAVYLGLSSNVGGFGIGNSARFSWDLTYANTFKVSDLMMVTAGYRHFSYRRVDGSGDNQLDTKVSVFGPMLGVSFMF